MRTVQWQLSYAGLTLSHESHAWDAGVSFLQHEEHFNIRQAGIRRPVRARLAQPVKAEQRFGRIVLTPAGFGMPIETLGVEVGYPVRKFEFDVAWLNRLLPTSLAFDFRSADVQPIFDEPIIEATLDRIYHELVSSRSDSADLLDAFLRIFAIDTARCLMSRRDRTESTFRCLAPEQVASIRYLIQTTEFRQLTLGYIAHKMAMRPNRLGESFKRSTGHSLRDEIEKARILAACRHLAETQQPLKVVAHALGFTHASAYCFWFKQATGCTPTQYRNRQAAPCAGHC